jgi:hypothetical protein
MRRSLNRFASGDFSEQLARTNGVADIVPQGREADHAISHVASAKQGKPCRLVRGLQFGF